MKKGRSVKKLLESRKATAKSPRDLFAAITRGWSPNIVEELTDGSVRLYLWSAMTTAERKRGKELVELLAPDPKLGFCAWKYPNRPKTPEVAKALQELVEGIERRCGIVVG
ncbi:MAG TPA: hypothetical protein VKB40_11110 [Candidatus Acidoferrales bacterium]|nr:hypothetical protein [Candidatus Acidoferrales bacterium]